MKGARPLNSKEIVEVSKQFDGTFEIRNRSLFMLGVSVGGRISELLALSIKDVYQNGHPVSDLLFEKDVVKGKETARLVPVNADGQRAIRELIDWHVERYGNRDTRRPLFPSRKHGKAISRVQAHRILEDAFTSAGLNGKLATHSLRKTYAQRMYDATGDIYLVKEMLGHKDVKTTQDYLGVSYAKAQAASIAIELNRSRFLLHSLAEISTGDLIAELLARGVDMTSAIQQMQLGRRRKVIALVS
jgi:site-specific recombinase XerD